MDRTSPNKFKSVTVVTVTERADMIKIKSGIQPNDVLEYNINASEKYISSCNENEFFKKLKEVSETC